MDQLVSPVLSFRECLMSMSSNQQAPYEDLERRIREEILPLFESVIKGNTTPYRNRNLDMCWKAIQSDPCTCLAMNEGQDQDDLVLDVTNFNSIDQGDARPTRPAPAATSSRASARRSSRSWRGLNTMVTS